MASQRRRNKGFHEENDTAATSSDGQFVTPQYDATADVASSIQHITLELDDDSPYPVGGDDDDESEEEDENEEAEQERFSRGRSRSRSLHSLDEDPNTGVVLIDANTISAISNAAGSAEATRPIEKVERSGPLPMREVETLKKGVEEAMHTRDSGTVREEQEEQLAAEEERKTRASSQQCSSSTETRRVKILMLGDSGVGKSSLIVRWTADSFSTDLVGTVGVNFKTRKTSVNGECIQAQVWDTAGQEQFHKITTSYYKGANGIMLVYDVSDRKSVENVEYWVRNIKSHASDTVHVALIGNKVDLRATNPTKCVDSSHGQQFSLKFGVPYFETSAKDSTNVEQAFHTLLTNIVSADSHDTKAAAATAAAARGPGEKDGSKKDKCVIS